MLRELRWTYLAVETEVQPNTKLSRATIYRGKALGLIPVALNIAVRPQVALDWHEIDAKQNFYLFLICARINRLFRGLSKVACFNNVLINKFFKELIKWEFVYYACDWSGLLFYTLYAINKT